MAISLNEVLAHLDAKTSLADEIICHIDDNLSDPRVVRGGMADNVANPTWRFRYEGTVTKGDKDFIVKQYQDAGWGGVQVVNSEDVGQLPGTVNIKLSQYPQE